MNLLILKLTSKQESLNQSYDYLNEKIGLLGKTAPTPTQGTGQGEKPAEGRRRSPSTSTDVVQDLLYLINLHAWNLKLTIS